MKFKRLGDVEITEDLETKTKGIVMWLGTDRDDVAALFQDEFANLYDDVIAGYGELDFDEVVREHRATKVD